MEKNLYEILKSHTNKESKILDLGTGGGEKVIGYFPECAEILATDFSEGMIETANKNLKESDYEFLLKARYGDGIDSDMLFTGRIRDGFIAIVLLIFVFIKLKKLA